LRFGGQIFIFTHNVHHGKNFVNNEDATPKIHLLAEVLAKNERQVVVLDDVLTAADAERLARAMTILEEYAEHLESLVLTCHPERYRALTEAQFFDMESLLKA
jgi:ABC-type polysaccharide/polyol phosphate transport system ATPase subunit